MNDEDLERALRRYRPRGPGADLRRKTLSAAVALVSVSQPRGGRAWVRLLAAAAAIAVAILGSWRASVIHEASAAQVLSSLARERETSIRQLTELLGGGEIARRQAMVLVVRWSRDPAAPTDGGSR